MWSMCVKGLDVRPKVACAAEMRVAWCSHPPVVRRPSVRWRGVCTQTDGMKTEVHAGSARWRRLCSAASKAVTTQDNHIFVRRIHCFGEAGDFEFKSMSWPRRAEQEKVLCPVGSGAAPTPEARAAL